ncbi:MAG: lysophospholipid acyltransferase family protein [Bacteroidales bacterium]|nr:lysophospholipid acyltransferase family protein [Bacteroidales bacterium]
MKEVLVDEYDVEKLSPIFRGVLGHFVAKILLRILGLNKINRLYSKTCHLKNHHFTSAWFKEMNLKYVVENREILNQFKEGGSFITVSNHPFGMLDGYIIIDLLSQDRPDFKFMVNTILMSIRPIEDNMIPVKPTTTKSGSTVENTTGLKATLRHLNSGGVVGFFPAGAVANYNEYKFKVTDREWQPTIIRMIQMAKVPVVPIFIHGRNSNFFNFLGRINWQLRSVRLPYEVLNKKNKTIKLTIGEPISLETQLKYKKTEELAAFLRAETYALSKKVTK